MWYTCRHNKPLVLTLGCPTSTCTGSTPGMMRRMLASTVGMSAFKMKGSSLTRSSTQTPGSWLLIGSFILKLRRSGRKVHMVQVMHPLGALPGKVTYPDIPHQLQFGLEFTNVILEYQVRNPRDQHGDVHSWQQFSQAHQLERESLKQQQRGKFGWLGQGMQRVRKVDCEICQTLLLSEKEQFDFG